MDHHLPNLTGRDLANSLLNHLEALANIHYLIDLHVTDSTRVKRLRALEDEIFSELVMAVQKAAGPERV